MTEPSETAPQRGFWASVGPAIITASVVLGPGSILAASKTGHQFGYEMVWLLVLAGMLMVGMTALSARLGVTLEGTLCSELARRAGRPVAAITGLSLFLIAACFQFGNNLGVLAAIEPFYSQESTSDGSSLRVSVPILVIVNLNILVIVALFGFSALYQPVERLMKFLVGVMMVGFAANLLMAQPNIVEILAGMIPGLPEGTSDTILPRWREAAVTMSNGKVIDEGTVVDKFRPVVALFATTFSVAGAFYQSYLVRQKGWTKDNLHRGLVDSAVGIGVLGLITMMIMVTAAAVLHGDDIELKSVADVARQLEPAFGKFAMFLFCAGIFAGAFSSFLVNAMIGGSILADGFGLGGYIDQRWPKLFTVLALAIGLNVAIYVHMSGLKPVRLIIFAQAITVLGFPLLAGAMLWLATRGDMTGPRRIPLLLKLAAWVSLPILLFLALRTAMTLLMPLIY